ncbi:hypothetical protein [Nguyenibacter sp. L1]|uniref:hypothetical protein n=1 Tax=Nguyenibacter sp. L1 TaxID=3049350 RepID=UPI002B4625ED|nr:hypothetical protein [Nguyenibacter sp. L1]WRH88506.1 hypothetical protein QN315_02405 [Nguyenibacter sp. L1]
MASIDWRPLSELSALNAHELDFRPGKAQGGLSASRRTKQRVGQIVATCAMGAWVLLAVVPVVVVIMAIGG